nr:GntR family transcriptional regulator [uncultured bacterium]
MTNTIDNTARRRGQSSAEVGEAIRQAIRGGELLPGMQIKQADWALRLGVSRVPVREALGMLESEGLLAHEPHQGYFVAILSESEIEQLYLLRRLLDREIASSLNWPDAAALEALTAIRRDADAALDNDDVGGWLACNDRFVLAVYALSPLDIVVGEAVRLWRRTETVRSGRVRYEWNQLSRDAIRQTIGRILSMLESRDRAGLKAALARLTHVRRVPAPRVLAL